MANKDQGKQDSGKQAPLRKSNADNTQINPGETRVSRNAVAKDGKIVKDGKEVNSKDILYKGTVRVVTEADIQADPRLVGASVVAGQLYDFSNLPAVKDGGAEANVEGYNEAKAEADEMRVAKEDVGPVAPGMTSEDERVRMGLASKEDMKGREDRDNEARKRVEERRKADKGR